MEILSVESVDAKEVGWEIFGVPEDASSHHTSGLNAVPPRSKLAPQRLATISGNSV